MDSSKVKMLVIVLVLLFAVSMITVGCRAKGKSGLMNTDTLPGHKYSHYVSNKNANRSSATVVYLGSDDSASGVSFGPSDVSFEFKSLK